MQPNTVIYRVEIGAAVWPCAGPGCALNEKTTSIYNPRNDGMSLDAVERIGLREGYSP